MKNFVYAAAAITIAAGFASSAFGAGSYGFNTPHQVEKDAEIHRAIESLEHANKYLRRAPHDYGGARLAAIAHVNAALSGLYRALKHDENTR